MFRELMLVVVVCLVWARPVVSESHPVAVQPSGAPSPALNGLAGRLIGEIPDVGLRSLLAEILEHSPELQARAADIRAAERRPERVRGLPDPTAVVTAFLETPETRVGPQRLSATVSQALPWSGKRELAASAAGLTVEVLRAQFEARQLALVTDGRRLFHELGFIEQQQQITEAFRQHLVRHEEISRAAYTTGRGSGHAVLKLQAEITRVDQRLLGLQRQRRSLEARLNALRDREAEALLPPTDLSELGEIDMEFNRLLERAMSEKPEVRAQDARLAVVDTEAERSRLDSRPDFRLGLVYTLVDDRDDLPGRINPPPDNGKDIFGVQAGLSIPLWRKHRVADLDEILERRMAIESDRRAVVSELKAKLGDLTSRIELTWRELRLLEDLLVVQAVEALDSARAAYVAGTTTVFELFDAEHVLFEAQTAIARAGADYRIAVAEIEGVVGGKVEPKAHEEGS